MKTQTETSQNCGTQNSERHRGQVNPLFLWRVVPILQIALAVWASPALCQPRDNQASFDEILRTQRMVTDAIARAFEESPQLLPLWIEYHELLLETMQSLDPATATHRERLARLGASYQLATSDDPRGATQLSELRALDERLRLLARRARSSSAVADAAAEVCRALRDQLGDPTEPALRALFANDQSLIELVELLGPRISAH